MAHKTIALTTELRELCELNFPKLHKNDFSRILVATAGQDRIENLQLFSLMLSQLSYRGW